MKNSVTFREKIGYGFGDMASSMFWKIFGMYLLFFYTKVFGITPAAAGTMFLVTRIWDSLNDPIMGLADRTRSRWGRYRRLPAVGCLSASPRSGVLTFWTPDFGMTGNWREPISPIGHDDGLYDGQRPPCLAARGDDARYEDTQYVFLLPDVLRLCGQSGDLHAVAAAGGFLCRTARRRRYRPVSRSVAGSDVAISGMPEAWTCAVAVIRSDCALLFWLCFRWTRRRIRINDAQLAEDRSAAT